MVQGSEVLYQWLLLEFARNRGRYSPGNHGDGRVRRLRFLVEGYSRDIHVTSLKSGYILRMVSRTIVCPRDYASRGSERDSGMKRNLSVPEAAGSRGQ